MVLLEQQGLDVFSSLLWEAPTAWASQPAPLTDSRRTARVPGCHTGAGTVLRALQLSAGGAQTGLTPATRLGSGRAPEMALNLHSVKASR